MLISHVGDLLISGSDLLSLIYQKDDKEFGSNVFSGRIDLLRRGN